MIILASTSDAVSVLTSAAGALQVHASYIDLNGSNVAPGRINTPTITTATTTTVVPSPAASTVRNIAYLNISNTGATNTVTVQHTDGTNLLKLIQVTLLTGQSLRYQEGVGWTVLPI